MHRCQIRSGLCLISIVLLSNTAQADIIHLKNGKQIECISAWEEGNQVNYTIPGGKITIPKSIVVKIEKKQYVKAETEIPKTFKQQEGKVTSVKPDEIKNLERQDKSKPQIKAQLTRLYTDAGFASVNKKDFTGALDYFLKAYDLTKDEGTASNLAAIYYLLKDDWNAEHYFNEVVKLNPSNSEALYYLGDISWRQEKLEEAQSYWQRAYEITGDPELKAKLARLGKENKASVSYENEGSRHFLIRYDGGNADPNLVREVSDFLEETYQQLSSEFDAYPSTSFVVVLYPRETYFNVTDMPLWSGGVNDGKIKLPVKGITSLSDELKSVLTHELTHSFVRFKTSDNYPVWLQEGLAQYCEGKRTGTEDTKALSHLIQRNQLPPVERLSGSFLGASSDIAAVLYAESLSFTEFLVDRYQFYQMNQLLEDLGKGTSFSEAFENTYGVSISQVERQWQDEFVSE